MWPGPLGATENHIHVLRRNDRFEMDGKAVREQQRLALGQIRRDVLFVNGGLLGVGQRHEDDVGAPHRFGGGDHFKALFLRHGSRFAAFVEADDDLRPLSFRLSAWAWPWEPKPSTARVLFLSTLRSASLSV